MAKVVDTLDMANGDAASVVWARLSERVDNQGKDITDLRVAMTSGFQSINSQISSLTNEVQKSGQTPWMAIWAALSVGIVILSGLGFMALQPIKDNSARLEEALVRTTQNQQDTVSKLADNVNTNMDTQQEMEWRTVRGSEDRKRMDEELKAIRESFVTHNEWSERNRARDGEITELGRRINELRAEMGSQYTARDMTFNMQAELKDLRNRMVQMLEDKAKSNGL